MKGEFVLWSGLSLPTSLSTSAVQFGKQTRMVYFGCGCWGLHDNFSYFNHYFAGRIRQINDDMSGGLILTFTSPERWPQIKALTLSSSFLMLLLALFDLSPNSSNVTCLSQPSPKMQTLSFGGGSHLGVPWRSVLLGRAEREEGKTCSDQYPKGPWISWRR